jgi:hypothetical protein
MARSRHHAKRRRFVPLVWIGSITAVVILGSSVNGSLSGFTASITNQANAAGTAQAPILVETGPNSSGTSTTCASTSGVNGAYTCTTINKYGNNGESNLAMVPGASASTTVTFANTSTQSASVFTLTAGTCTSGEQGAQSGTGNLCSDGTFTVSIQCAQGTSAGSSALNEGPVAPASLTSASPMTITGGLAAGTAPANTVTCTVTTALAGTATDAEAGLTATQDLTWTIST